jgi:hypothetical protein
MNRLLRSWQRSLPKTTHTTNQRLILEQIEARNLPSVSPDNLISLPFFGDTVDSTVQLLDPTTGALRIPPIVAFPGYHGALVSATGDVNGDGVSDVIVGAQAPNGHVKVFDGATGNLLQSFFAFPGFNGAVNVGSADVNGDHFADVLVTANATNGHVKAFSGRDGSELASFFAFPGFAGQTSVAGADFNHDGLAEIVVGAGAPGVGGRVAIFNADGSVFNPGFFAFPGYDGGIQVLAGDVSGDGTPDIVVGAGDVPGGHVKAFSGVDFSVLQSFIPFGPSVTNGIDVRLADTNGDGVAEVLVYVARGNPPNPSPQPPPHGGGGGGSVVFIGGAVVPIYVPIYYDNSGSDGCGCDVPIDDGPPPDVVSDPAPDPGIPTDDPSA